MAGIRSTPVFLGLTRTTLFFGVSLKFFALNFSTSILLFSYTNDLKILSVAILLHGIGYYISFNDALLVDIYFNKLTKCNRCLNKFLHKANSYLT